MKYYKIVFTKDDDVREEFFAVTNLPLTDLREKINDVIFEVEDKVKSLDELIEEIEKRNLCKFIEFNDLEIEL